MAISLKGLSKAFSSAIQDSGLIKDLESLGMESKEINSVMRRAHKNWKSVSDDTGASDYVSGMRALVKGNANYYNSYKDLFNGTKLEGTITKLKPAAQEKEALGEQIGRAHEYADYMRSQGRPISSSPRLEAHEKAFKQREAAAQAAQKTQKEQEALGEQIGRAHEFSDYARTQGHPVSSSPRLDAAARKADIAARKAKVEAAAKERLENGRTGFAKFDYEARKADRRDRLEAARNKRATEGPSGFAKFDRETRAAEAAAGAPKEPEGFFGKVKNFFGKWKDKKEELTAFQQKTHKQLEGFEFGEEPTGKVAFGDVKAAHEKSAYQNTKNFSQELAGAKSRTDMDKILEANGIKKGTSITDALKQYGKAQKEAGAGVADYVEAYRGHAALAVGTVGMGAIAAFDNGGSRSNAQLYGQV